MVRARLSFVASTVKPELDRCADCSGIVLKARRNYHVRCLLKQQRYPYHDENESFPVYDSMTLQTFMVWLIHSFSWTISMFVLLIAPPKQTCRTLLQAKFTFKVSRPLQTWRTAYLWRCPAVPKATPWRCAWLRSWSFNAPQLKGRWWHWVNSLVLSSHWVGNVGRKIIKDETHHGVVSQPSCAKRVGIPR